MTIAEIKQRLSMADVLDHYGLKPKNGQLHCPFHQDKHPSMHVYDQTDTVFCFSANCELNGKAIDQIDFILHMEGCSKSEAVRKAGELAGNFKPKKKPSEPSKPLADPSTRTALVTKVYRQAEGSLKKSRVAREYLDSRALSETAGYLPEGYSKTWNPHLKATGETFGLLKDGKETWRGHVVYALKDQGGALTGLYGRSINGHQHKYLKGPHSGLYPEWPDPQTTGTVVLTESLLDAEAIRRHTNYQVLALYGTNGLTDDHKTALQSCTHLEEIILFFDGDAAGRKASEKCAEALGELLDVQISRVEPPEDEDPASLPVPPSPQILNHLIDERTVIASGDPLTKKAPPQPTSQPTGTSSGLDTSNPNKITYQTSTANYYIKGGIRKDLDSMKVTLVVEHPETKTKSRNKLDLYEDKQTERVAREAGEKLGLRPDLIEADLSRLTDLLDEHRESETGREDGNTKQVLIPSAEKAQCINLLKSPNLLPNINTLIGQSGVVGEETNRLFLFGIAGSYKNAEPLHALIQGSSGSGKTHLLAAIMDLMPQEDTISLTRVTESSFYNYGKHELSHKLIGLEDYDGLGEDAELAFRELQSKGKLSSSTSGKNEHTGESRGYVKDVYGPIASLSATTHGEIYEDNMSRCFLVAVDESHEQTMRIIKYQNRRAAGGIDKQKKQEAKTILQNCIRLLKPYEVINPYADKIDLPREAHKIRRLNELFQSYVRQITILHQYQRKQTSTGELITEKQDIKAAIEIMFDSILLKVDELDGSLRDFYERLKDYVKAKGQEYEFTQREIRQAMRLSKTQMHRYFNSLLELEYIYRSHVGIRNTYQFKISYWDNMQALRDRIKRDMMGQLEAL